MASAARRQIIAAAARRSRKVGVGALQIVGGGAAGARLKCWGDIYEQNTFEPCDCFRCTYMYGHWSGLRHTYAASRPWRRIPISVENGCRGTLDWPRPWSLVALKSLQSTDNRRRMSLLRRLLGRLLGGLRRPTTSSWTVTETFWMHHHASEQKTIIDRIPLRLHWKGWGA